MDNRMQVIIDDLDGHTVREYEGVVTERDEQANMIQIEARYQGEAHELGEAHVEEGDRVIIRFFEGRMYNVVYIFDHRRHQFEGWYINFMRPPTFEDSRIHAQSLDLALFVRANANGSLVLNRDRFEALDLPDEDREAVEDELAYLLQAAEENAPPFGAEEPTSETRDQSMEGPDENLAKDPKRNIKLNDPRTDRRQSTEN